MFGALLLFMNMVKLNKLILVWFWFGLQTAAMGLCGAVDVVAASACPYLQDVLNLKVNALILNMKAVAVSGVGIIAAAKFVPQYHALSPLQWKIFQ